MGEDLAQRAVACKHWRWLPGMLTTDRLRVVRADPDGYVLGWSTGGYVWALNADALPGLTDPATLGCLLALVREARQESTWLPTCLDAEDEAWVVEPPSRNRQTRHESYAAVLVAALEAAP